MTQITKRRKLTLHVEIQFWARSFICHVQPGAIREASSSISRYTDQEKARNYFAREKSMAASSNVSIRFVCVGYCVILIVSIIVSSSINFDLCYWISSSSNMVVNTWLPMLDIHISSSSSIIIREVYLKAVDLQAASLEPAICNLLYYALFNLHISLYAIFTLFLQSLYHDFYRIINWNLDRKYII